MKKILEGRYLTFLGFSGFLGFLGFLGTDNYQHMAKFASLACLSAAAFLVFIPRDPAKVPAPYRLDDLAAIVAALTGGKTIQADQDQKKRV